MNPAIVEARRLHAAGELKQAYDQLVFELYDQGWSAELQAEIERLFPITPDVVARLEDFETRLNDADKKIRQKAAKELSRIGLGELSNKSLDFLRHPEARALLIKHLEHEDPVVREHMTIALAMCFQRYVLDPRAFEPLLPRLAEKSINTRAWAVSALARLGERSAEHLLALLDDKTERVRREAFAELGFGLDGGGVLSRRPWSPAVYGVIREALRKPGAKHDIDDRCIIADLWLVVAEPSDLPYLESWRKKDGSKTVKKFVQKAIDRLRNPPPPAPPKEPKPRRKPPSPPPPPPPDDSAFAPCRFVLGEDGGMHSLLWDDFASTADVFEEFGREGGGYDWHAVVDALVRIKRPELAKAITYDPEASLFAAVSRDRTALVATAELIRAALTDEKLLRQALKKANPKLKG